MINEGKYWTPNAEVWNEDKCRKVAKRVDKDSYGNRHPFKGLVSDYGSVYGYGKRRYNGGITRDGDWWEGTNIPFPKIHKDYVYVSRPTWGIYLMTKVEAKKENLKIL